MIPDFDPDTSNITPTEQKWADDALNHVFFVHSGYQPSYFYGDDIDWTYWPVKDNELRWQLHRTKWWVPMGKAWRATHDEKYAREWTAEYVDWIRKNPEDGYDKYDFGNDNMSTAPNVLFAWRPLEVSDRVENQIKQFALFLPSKSFTPEFLCEFLVNYHAHCDFLMRHFTPVGNHRLFEAKRLLLASVYFHEFKDATEWKERAIEILNEEIGKQVYPDGMQYELDPHYHLEAIKIFFDALRVCRANGVADAFPPSYMETIHKMIEVVYNYSYPDYCNPAFSDFHGQHDMIPLYKEWAEAFPEDKMVLYLATEGREGDVPDYLSRPFPVSGFYCLRNGWDEYATVMVVKGGPKGEWHCQPDNGTFEYWRKGRNFFPDSGAYCYGGDEDTQKARDWFRQTSIHNTLTLNGMNLDSAATRLTSWIQGPDSVEMTIENPSYKGLTHTRTVVFRKDGSVTVTDKASGSAEGEVAIHYSLVENCSPEADTSRNTVKTRFQDGNNITISVFSPEGAEMKEQEGRVSYSYRHYLPRPSYSFSVSKAAGQTVTFTTTIVPSGL
jgi:heparan-sulfate lyase